MTPFEKLSAVLARIASGTSIIRTQHEDAERREVHGATVSEFTARADAAATRYEQVAVRLEQAIS